MEEAERLTAAGKFDEAYDYFARLHANSRLSLASKMRFASTCGGTRSHSIRRNSTTGRWRACSRSTRKSAIRWPAGCGGSRGRRDHPALSARWELRGRPPRTRSVADTIQERGGGAGRQLAATFETAAGRQVARRVIGEPASNTSLPARQRAAHGHLAEPRFGHGRNGADRREFPFVTVGVLEASPRKPVRRIDNWASLRTSRAHPRRLAEEVDFGSEGGVYARRSANGRSMRAAASLRSDMHGGRRTDARRPRAAHPVDGHAGQPVLSRRLRLAPRRRFDLAAERVALHFERVHVRPESMLQVARRRTARDRPGRPVYSRRFRARPGGVLAGEVALLKNARPGPQAIVEQTMSSDDAAVTALAGDVDVLDRVPPWHLDRLRAVQDIRVESYKLPTVHVLIPNLKRPLLAKREFRRGLCFGIDRKWIVERVLLGGGTLQGFEAISGPFPAGVSLNDPIRYGYNNQLAAAVRAAAGGDPGHRCLVSVNAPERTRKTRQKERRRRSPRKSRRPDFRRLRSPTRTIRSLAWPANRFKPNWFARASRSSCASSRPTSAGR